MLNRRTFLKTTLAAGTALTLNPFSFGKEKTLRWRRIEELTDMTNPVFLGHTKIPYLGWMEFKNDDSSLTQQKIVCPGRKIMYQSELEVNDYDQKRHVNICRNFGNASMLNPLRTGIIEKKHVQQIMENWRWMPVEDIVYASVSQDLSLLKRGKNVVVIYHAPDTPVHYISDKETIIPEPGYRIYRSGKVKAKPRIPEYDPNPGNSKIVDLISYSHPRGEIELTLTTRCETWLVIPTLKEQKIA